MAELVGIKPLSTEDDIPFIANQPGENVHPSLINTNINWSKLTSPYGILPIFGFMYWLTITIIAFSIQFDDSSQSWLFKYSVTSMVIAICCQFGIIAMVISGYDSKTAHFCNTKFPVTTLASFPYSLLICCDLFIHVGATFLGKQYIENGFSIAFIACHSVSLFGLSALDFQWHLSDKAFRYINFIFEWVDIAFQIVVVLLYSTYSKRDDKMTITKVYWGFTFIQLVFWVPPICLGIARNIKNLLKLIFILDLVTDIPFIITTLVTGAYAVHFWIFLDLIFKVLLMVRGVVYNGCIYMLLPYLVDKN